MSVHLPTAGLILAGGLARRMGGGDKGLLPLGDESLLDHVVRRLALQASPLALNANGDPGRFARLGLPVVPDDLPGYPGPLAGVLAGLDWVATAAPGVNWVLTVPADSPFIPTDLSARLHAGRGAAPLACAASNGRTHPVVALWQIGLRYALREAVLAGQRRVGAFLADHGAAVVSWAIEGGDPFFNVNTPDDLAAARTASRPGRARA